MIGLIGGLILVLVIVLWVSVLFSKQPLRHPLISAFPWPIACSRRGCVSSRTWARLWQTQTTFAQTTDTAVPTEAQTLTTAVRRHLVQKALVRSSLSMADVRRYREEVLHLKDPAMAQEHTGLSLTQYDRFVLLPFLQQEELGQRQQVATLPDLFRQLSQERSVFILPRGLVWDIEKAEVVSK